MDLLVTFALILLVLWMLGFGFGIAGNLIHTLVVIALVIIVVRLLTGRSV